MFKSHSDEALRNEAIWLMTDLRITHPTKKNFVLTGCHGKEGVSSMAVAMAMAITSLEPCSALVIDANFSNRKGLSNKHKLGQKPGLRNWGEQQFEEGGTKTIDTFFSDNTAELKGGARLLGLGQVNQIELLHMARDGTLKQFIDAASKSIDYLFWDTASINVSINTKVIVQAIPNVILLTQSDVTRQDHFASSIGQLSALDAEPLSVVRNRAGRTLFGVGANQQ